MGRVLRRGILVRLVRCIRLHAKKLADDMGESHVGRQRSRSCGSSHLDLEDRMKKAMTSIRHIPNI